MFLFLALTLVKWLIGASLMFVLPVVWGQFKHTYRKNHVSLANIKRTTLSVRVYVCNYVCAY